MSLYRTWRPKSFNDLVGQDVVVRTLRTALTGGKIAHAYLFSGPRGSGKTSAAKIFARCLNCAHGPTPEPDNTCEHCTAMLAGSGLDVLEIDAASNRGIDEIRALREAVKFAPVAMRYKIFIVDEAHMLTREGANAFLKTLEEPPPHAIFILATTAPEQLPVTILSRCQRYAFARIPVAVMIERMRVIAQAEGITIDDQALGAIAYRADGGLRDALTMLEQTAAFADGVIDAQSVERAFGASGRHFARALVSEILRSDGAAALRTIETASDSGADMQGVIRNVLAEYRHLLVARIDPTLLSHDLSPTDAQAAVAAAAVTPQPKVVRALRLFSDALVAARTSGNPRLELDTVVLRLVMQGEDPTLDALATRVALLEQQIAGHSSGAASATVTETPETTTISQAPLSVSAPAPTMTPKSAEAMTPVASPVSIRSDSVVPSLVSARSATLSPTRGASVAVSASAPQEPTLQRVRSLWPNVRTRAESEKVPLRMPLARATVEAVTADTVVVGMGDEITAGILRDHAEIMERALHDVLGVPLRLQVRVRSRQAQAQTQASPPDALSRADRPSAEPAASDSVPSEGETDLLAYALHKLNPRE